MGDVRLILGDCHWFLPAVDTSAVALVLTDPPYGVGMTLHWGRTGGRIAERYRTIPGDDSPEAGEEVLAWAARHELPTVAFADPMRPWPGEWRQHLVWYKGEAVGGLGDYRRCWRYTWELVQVARNGPLRAGRDGDILRFPVKPTGRLHPAEKPVPLLAYLIGQLTAPGELVFDPFMGSGSVGVACVRTGRRFLGVEIDPGYYETARRRVEEARSEGPLFAPKAEPELFPASG